MVATERCLPSDSWGKDVTLTCAFRIGKCCRAAPPVAREVEVRRSAPSALQTLGILEIVKIVEIVKIHEAAEPVTILLGRNYLTLPGD